MVLIGNPFPQLLLGFLFVQYSCMFQLIQSFSNFTDQSALIAFKSQISSSPNETLLATNWSTTPNSICNWIGVSCSRRRQRVTALDLSYMGLEGSISPHIGNLSFLVSLRLSNNSFFGFIPHEISHLHRLRILFLSFNQLEGSIPPAIHNCRKLRKVSFDSNRLIGAIPSFLGNLSKLEFLNLQRNSLTGPLPSVIFNISSLNTFAVTSNHISGAPNDLCSHYPNLRRLYLSDNKFGGQLHLQFNNCGELAILSLSYNKFDGSISKALIGSLQNLEVLYLGGNSFTGIIPSTIRNLSRLQGFGIEYNHIQGSIPTDLWQFQKLTVLYLGGNNFEGAVPQKVFNLSTLQRVTFEYNSLSGYLPSLHMGQSCPNLEEILLSTNKLSGQIPSYLSNCSKLNAMDFCENLFSGPIPKSLGNLKHLQLLSLSGNQLIGGEAKDHKEPNFISSLSNCRFLKELFVNDNPLDITIPDSIQNFSASLQIFVAENCHIKGHIPMGMGSLKGLNWLDLANNNLTGNIPFTFGGLERLQRLFLDSNELEGLIPEEICQLRNLGELDLSNNKISRVIPNCISNLSLLVKLYLNSNRLESSIPLDIWSLKNLLFLDLSLNSLGGHFSSNMKKLDTLEYLDLSRNQIIGEIPSIIGAFESLRYLDFSNNSFQGSIPQSFGNLKGLDALDLCHNKLSGAIPKSLEALPSLKYLNLSFNMLVGEIPSSGSFVNFTAESFSGNRALCGNPIFGVPRCPMIPTYQQSKMKNIFLKSILPVIASIIITLVMLFYLLRRLRKSNTQIPTSLNALPALEHRMISYQELCQGTNNFCESNLLGAGSFSSVYKGILSNRTIVAVKVLRLQFPDAFKSFNTECKVLRTIRHRNLVKVITTCTNMEFKALVLEYMSKGNLERWLYSHNYCLDLLQRINIMVDVASALDYLHHGQSESILHCDLKPTNILLDEDMVAHVGDFGITKILVENKDATHTKTLGTIGYMAPEYGFEGMVSIKSDVYSFGIVLLEMITRKKPTDDMFAGDFTLRQLVNESIPDRMMEVVDEGLLRIEDGRDSIAMQSILSSILDLGLRCSGELPDTRMDIKDVVVKLNKIKSTFFVNRNRVTRHT